MQGSPEKGESFKRSIEFLKGKLAKGWFAFAVFSEGKPVGKAIVSAPDDSPFPISGDGVYALHCIYVIPRLTKQGYGSALLEFLEEVIHNTDGAKGIAALSYGEYWMPAPFFLCHGYEFVSRDSLASLLLKRFDPQATASFQPAHPFNIIASGKVRVDINYDPTCPFLAHHYLQIKDIASAYGGKVEVYEHFIDSSSKWKEFGEPNVYINNKALPFGPISEKTFRREIDSLLGSV